LFTRLIIKYEHTCATSLAHHPLWRKTTGGLHDLADLNDGQKLANKARNQSNSHNVTLGIGDGLMGVMRFFPQNIVIHVNDTITFTNRDSMNPHTVSFGTFPPGTDNFVPFGTPGCF
jgi:plastocyanin